MKILIIEDEKPLSEMIAQSLSKENYWVEQAFDFDAAIEKASIYQYDCILLDISLPGGSGLEILKSMKEEGKTDNVIIISAKNSLEDKLEGLTLGADDYLIKPFYIAELTARIKAVIRRGKLNGKNEIVIENCVLNIDDRTFHIDNKEIAINRKEFEMLQYLMINKNRLVNKTAIAEHIWGDNIDQADNFDFVYYQIKNLRKKLQNTNALIEIQSVYGVGYKLVEK